MIRREKNNSIIFLTTLSVYLGLVLVGGAMPSVLAQAATTRNFNVQDEIEVKDDLDKKPPDEELDFSGALKSYFEDVEDLIEDFQKYHRNKKFDLDSEKFNFERHTGIGCNIGGQEVVNGDFVRKIDHRAVERAIDSAIYDFNDWEIFSDCLPTETFKDNFTNRYKLKVSYDTSELKIEISALKRTNQRADYLTERFKQSYGLYEVDEENALVKSIYQNTFINSENNQVFIVTRLPRGSLDELLKQDAKAESK
jgi:hypothetical protein